MRFLNSPKNKFTLIISLFVFLFFILSFKIVYSADLIKFTPQIPIPGPNSIPANSTIGAAENGTLKVDLLNRYIKSLYDYLIIIAGILAAVVMMGGGVLWLTSGGNENRVTQAKDLIFGSVVGLILVFSSYLILNMVNPDLLNFDSLKIKMVDKKEMSTLSTATWGCCYHPKIVGIGSTWIDSCFDYTDANECRVPANSNDVYELHPGKKCQNGKCQ